MFDGSCPSDNGTSLNQIQLVEPTIQQDLFAILIRFRKYPIAITGDVEKMYRMVLVHESQRDYQRILWRKNPSDPIDVYQLNTVTYETASAPFLAIRCLYDLAKQANNSQIARIIKNDFYVDDLLTGAYTKNQVIQIQKQLNQVLESAQFHLRKWASNDKQFLKVVASDNASDHTIVRVQEGSDTKTLGVAWNTKTDMFQYSLNSLIKNTNVTKRSILSSITQIYDPLGLLAPVIIKAKLIMQKLWQQGYTWDESISHTLYSEWTKFVNELTSVTTINIPRYILCRNLIHAELHGFCDSSESAYGACFFVKCIDINDQVKTNLLYAKTRVAPLHPVTIPKLELCAALLLAELLTKILNSLDMKFIKIILWSDSTIALSWIHTPIHNLLPFVAHRVSKILQHTTAEQWHHVRSHENPADLLTRRINSSKLRDLSLWWKGPHWLQSNNNTISIVPFTPTHDISQLPEIKKSKITLSALQNSISYFNKQLF